MLINAFGSLTGFPNLFRDTNLISASHKISDFLLITCDIVIVVKVLDLIFVKTVILSSNFAGFLKSTLQVFTAIKTLYLSNNFLFEYPIE